MTTSTSTTSNPCKWAQDALSTRPLFFWKPEDDHGYFCQWYQSPITENGMTFNCAEQYMMYHKALTFSDTASMAAILKEKKPVKQKGLGKKVQGFKDEVWDRVKFDVVVSANYIKFSSGVARKEDSFVYPDEDGEDVELKTLLLATGERELVEASRFERVWGIGFSAVDAEQQSRKSWGLNLLGKAIMEVRKRLREEEEAEKEKESEMERSNE